MLFIIAAVMPIPESLPRERFHFDRKLDNFPPLPVDDKPNMQSIERNAMELYSSFVGWLWIKD